MPSIMVPDCLMHGAVSWCMYVCMGAPISMAATAYYVTLILSQALHIFAVKVGSGSAPITTTTTSEASWLVEAEPLPVPACLPACFSWCLCVGSLRLGWCRCGSTGR